MKELGENKVKFSFLILHYQTIKDTIECVESILKNMKYDNYNIIIVDNGSNNGSGLKLEKKYKHDSRIKVLINKENLGFAKGNNIGFRYIKNKGKSDFIIMINNDTIIKQGDFLDKIFELYEKEKFHILGPKIISLVNGKNQNPQPVLFESKKDVMKMIIKLRILYILNLIKADGFVKTYTFIKNFFKKSNSISFNDKGSFKLHGSCLIFSKDYIKNYEGLYNGTFMYMEEDILYFIAKKDSLKMLYNPEIIIYHKEDSATNSILEKTSLKKRFFYKNSIQSLKELLKLMKKSK